jgi:hypothetical protein
MPAGESPASTLLGESWDTPVAAEQVSSATVAMVEKIDFGPRNLIGKTFSADESLVDT